MPEAFAGCLVEQDDLRRVPGEAHVLLDGELVYAGTAARSMASLRQDRAADRATLHLAAGQLAGIEAAKRPV